MFLELELPKPVAEAFLGFMFNSFLNCLNSCGDRASNSSRVVYEMFLRSGGSVVLTMRCPAMTQLD